MALPKFAYRVVAAVDNKNGAVWAESDTVQVIKPGDCSEPSVAPAAPPARVDTTPSGEIRRTLLLKRSATYTKPVELTASPCGL